MSIYVYDKQNQETVTTTKDFKKSKKYDMYAEDLKYEDSKNNKVLHSQKIVVDENNKKSFTNVTIKSTEEDETIKADKAYIEDKSSEYVIKGGVKYSNKDLVITSDEATYDNDKGEVNAKGNFKIVINDNE